MTYDDFLIEALSQRSKRFNRLVASLEHRIEDSLKSVDVNVINLNFFYGHKRLETPLYPEKTNLLCPGKYLQTIHIPEVRPSPLSDKVSNNNTGTTKFCTITPVGMNTLQKYLQNHVPKEFKLPKKTITRKAATLFSKIHIDSHFKFFKFF